MKQLNQDTLDSLLELLTKKGDVGELPDTGICSYLDFCTEEYLYELFTGWKYHSGCQDFVVPSSRSNLNIKDAEGAYCTSGTDKMWVTGEYSELRWDLVEYCITKLQDELSEEGL